MMQRLRHAFLARLGLATLLCCIICLAAAPRAMATDGRFTLGPGDVLGVSVWKDEVLDKEVLVRPDGMISYPLIGDIQASGKTVEELRQAIQEKIAAYVPDAPVTVLLLQLGSPRVFVVGKVAKPGMFLMAASTSVMQVLAMAGGLTTFADEDGILVLRGGKAIPFDYAQAARGKNLEQNIVLQPDDTVVVP